MDHSGISPAASQRRNAGKVRCTLTMYKFLYRIAERLMPRLTFTSLFALMAASAALLVLPACSPTFNWRDVRPDNTRLSVLLPCKPDTVQKIVPLGGRPTELTMLGCDAGGATFAVAVADLGDASKVAAVLVQWQNLTLANMKAPPAGAAAGPRPATQVLPLQLAGTGIQPPAVLVKARGQRPDGTAVTGQAAYFAQGSQVFQVVLYADKVTPEVSESFFSSLKFE